MQEESSDTDQSSQPPPPVVPPQALPQGERSERLSRMVSSRTLEGWVVVDRNDRDATAVLMLAGKPVNHILHFLIRLFTCGIWWIVWLILALTQKKEKRVRVSIDQYGNLLEETMAAA